jgi:hypothetical protein
LPDPPRLLHGAENLPDAPRSVRRGPPVESAVGPDSAVEHPAEHSAAPLLRRRQLRDGADDHSGPQAAALGDSPHLEHDVRPQGLDVVCLRDHPADPAPRPLPRIPGVSAIRWPEPSHRIAGRGETGSQDHEPAPGRPEEAVDRRTGGGGRQARRARFQGLRGAPGPARHRLSLLEPGLRGER